MEIETILWIAAILSLVGALWLNSIKKADAAKVAGIFVVGLGVLAYLTGAGMIAPLAAGPSADVPSLVPGVEDGTCVVKPYTKVTFQGDTYPTGDPAAPAGSVDIYAAGINPSETGVNKLDTISVTAGVGNTTTGVLESCTNYGIIYNGAAAEYDQWYNDLDYTNPNQLPYISTTDSSIANVNVKFPGVIVVATIPDPIEENSVTGIINGQTNVSGEASSTNELQVGTDSTPADSDVIYYNKTNGDLSFYIDITLGAEGANKKLKDPALCFVRLANPMDGDEFDAVTLTYRSGQDFALPVDITEYVNDGECVPMGAWIEAGRTGDYRLQFTVVNANCDVGTDILYIYPDDCGEYLGKDILKNTKATAGAVIEIQFEA